MNQDSQESAGQNYPAGAVKPKAVLVGPPGAGKTTIGRRLASALNLDVVDSDKLIEQGEGKACGEVFSELGEPKFRELEAEYVAKALRTNGVVSLGGGAVLTESVRDLLRDQTVIWIDVSAEEGVRRTGKSQTRPVLQAADPVQHYQDLLVAREPFYRSVASYRVRTDKRPPQRIVAEVLGIIDVD